MEASRKRKHSTEASFLPQLKCYVDDNIQNRQSEKKMQEIYGRWLGKGSSGNHFPSCCSSSLDRTVNLLFKGAQEKQAKQLVDKNAKFREIKTQEADFVNGGKMPDWFTEAPVLVCNTCMSNSKLSVDCLNCNMSICERCAYECSSCRDPLCHSCVNLLWVTRSLSEDSIY